jgi:hypothetical protein
MQLDANPPRPNQGQVRQHPLLRGPVRHTTRAGKTANVVPRVASDDAKFHPLPSCSLHADRGGVGRRFKEFAMSTLSSRVARRSGSALALLVGLLVGILFQLVLIPLQPRLEPGYAWVEVAVGAILAVVVAEAVALRQERLRSFSTVLDWRTYRATVLDAFIGVGVPVVIYEIVNHLILGHAVSRETRPQAGLAPDVLPSHAGRQAKKEQQDDYRAEPRCAHPEARRTDQRHG